jgi:hypothetical protein
MDTVFLLRHRAPNGTDTDIGFYSTLSAAEAGIEVAKWQPTYRSSPDAFIIVPHVLNRTFSFENDTSDPLMLVIEPWASSEIILPGSKVDVRYPSPSDRDDASYADRKGNSLVFWCYGPTYEVDIDGVRIVT